MGLNPTIVDESFLELDDYFRECVKNMLLDRCGWVDPYLFRLFLNYTWDGYVLMN